MSVHSALPGTYTEGNSRQATRWWVAAGVGQCWGEWSREQRTGSVRDMESSCCLSRCEVCPALSSSAMITHWRVFFYNSILYFKATHSFCESLVLCLWPSWSFLTVELFLKSWYPTPQPQAYLKRRQVLGAKLSVLTAFVWEVVRASVCVFGMEYERERVNGNA